MYCFCKTRLYKYDVAVLACLVAAYHAGGIHVTDTDGEAGDWIAATAFVRRALGDDSVRNPMAHAYSDEEMEWLDKCQDEFWKAFPGVRKEEYGLDEKVAQ
jgi:hypothetical protein